MLRNFLFSDSSLLECILCLPYPKFHTKSVKDMQTWKASTTTGRVQDSGDYIDFWQGHKFHAPYTLWVWLSSVTPKRVVPWLLLGGKLRRMDIGGWTIRMSMKMWNVSTSGKLSRSMKTWLGLDLLACIRERYVEFMFHWHSCLYEAYDISSHCWYLALNISVPL